MTKKPYTIGGRLPDVLALIQVLAFDPDTHRSEGSIVRKELGVPSSAQGWTVLAKEHPEFFRVFGESETISLIARHVQPSGEGGKREPLTSDFTKVLLETAIDIHDRQIQAAGRGKYVSLILPSVVTGLLVILSAFVTTRVIHPAQSGRFVKEEDFGAGVMLDSTTGQLCLAGLTPKTPTSPNLPTCTTLH